MKGLIVLATIVSAIVYGCNFSDYGKEMQRQNASEEARRAAERARQVEANKVPRIVSRSADGCAVYAFNPDDGRWRYFTRCGDQTTTDNTFTYQQRHGKTTTTVTVPDAITTERR